ncbi:MAG: hypothetical protein JO210_18650, partial [Acidobacteriaceae bacterium]|nr:hypothetical protein [Acidobacteriaceae bacterium]
QHHWLVQRALGLQSLCFNIERPICDEEKQLALYLRYQTTHERAFHKCLRELATLRAGRKKAEAGFESQKRAEAAEERKKLDESRKQASETRRQELHSARLTLLEMRIATKKLASVAVGQTLSPVSSAVKAAPQHAPEAAESLDIQLETAA